MGTPASSAMAVRWSTVFVEQPRAMSTVRAFSKASGLMIFRGVNPFSSISSTFWPATLASRSRAAITAGTVPFPGSPRPMASVRQFMELAVNIPEQEPQVGQAASSMADNSSSVIFPARTAPTHSKTVIRSIFFDAPWVGWLPASMGPPLTTTVGMSRRAAAMSMPGTILSQLGTSTRASKAWAVAMISMESAMSSRLASEYFMPVWPMAMPSQTPMTPNSTGVPPAI